jgi:uncharacterized integral membrane protein
MRQPEIVTLVRAGRWPDGCDDDARSHVTACADCTESVQIASLLADDHRAALRTAPVPRSGLVWWRIQRRASEEAARNAARVVTLVQGICVVLGIALAVRILGAGNLNHAFAQWNLPLILGITLSLALAPVAVAVYLAVSRD